MSRTGKRRAQTEDEEDEAVVGSSSSTPHGSTAGNGQSLQLPGSPSASKRQRRQGQQYTQSIRQQIQEMDEEPVGEDTEAEEDQASEAESHAQPTGARRGRGGSQHRERTVEHDSEGDDDEEMALEAREQAREEQAMSVPAMAGVIERVSVTNFMCHDRLVIDLGPRLNFVIGHNGSGKSAILTGITLALGAKASTTSRGTSVKSFVKHGKQAAAIEVTIKNTGDDAYKHDVYGDKIVVERNIRADGGGSWKIKNAQGKIIANRREELDHICDHCNIQVDNPLNILTQDAARQFLTSSNPHELYEFFMRGTQLRQLSNEYDLIQLNVQRISAAIRQKKEILPELRQRATEAAERLSVIEGALELREELDEIHKQIVYVQVQDKYNEIEDHMEKLTRVQNSAKKLRDKIEESKALIEVCEGQIAELEAVAQDAMANIRPLEQDAVAAATTLKEQAARCKALRDRSQLLNTDYQRTKQTLEDIEARIVAEERDANGGRDTRRSRLAEERNEKEQQRKELEREEAEYRQRQADIDVELQQIEQQCEARESDRDQCRRAITELEGHIHQLRSTRTNHMSAYGPNMPRLLNMVQAETRWRGRVVGPLGAKIKLLEHRWAPVLESVIGNTLNAFCVTNVHDRNLLNELKQRAGCNEVSIITGSDEMFDYTGGEPDEHILTILRVLRIDDEFVKRQLINAVSVERCALVDRRADGDQLLRQRPRNVKMAYSLDLFRVQYGEAGGSTQTLQAYRGAPRLSGDVEARLAEATRRQPELEQRLRGVMSELERLQEQRRNLREEHHTIRARVPRIQKEARACHAREEQIDEELQQDQPSNISALEESRQEIKATLETMQREFGEQAELLARENEKVEELKTIRNEKAALVAQRRDESREIQPRIEKKVMERVQLTSDANHHQERLTRQEVKEKELLDEVKALEKTWKDWRKVARERFDSDDMEVRRHEDGTYWTKEQIERAERKIKKRIEMAQEEHGGDIDTIQRETDQKIREYTQAKDDVDNLKKARDRFAEAIRLRVDKWWYFRRRIAYRSRTNFQVHMAVRNFSGRLDFNHRKGSLEPIIITDPALGEAGEKKALSLSGGEKSYSTICLLLALWEAIGCPIRCLDEFDVFMDAVNRKLSMKLVMDAAKKNVAVQYILITPQNIQNVQFGPEVRMHRLADPERNQTTLD